MRLIHGLLLGLFCSLFFIASGDPEGMDNGYPYDIPFERVEIPVYHFEEFRPQTALRMDYASSHITNAEEWLRIMDRCEVEEIDLVFTQYPLDSSRWRTQYNTLLKNRLTELFKLDPSLNNKKLKWKMVLQYGCQSEQAAQNFFHGFVIKYKVTRPGVMNHPSTIWDIEKIILGKASPEDSTVLKVMDRNKHWEEMLVVMDWTGSMYPYGAQVVLWHKLNFERSGIKHFVFFNDGNRKATDEKFIGRTGGIYYARSRDLNEIMEVMGTVMANGYGGDSPENDLEAVMKGIRNLNDYKEVLLIADNKSVVRDLPLLKNIDKPVRVILCGAKKRKLNPDYLEIAFKTKGSIHTIEEDILTMGNLKEGDIIDIQGFRYKVRNGELEFFE